MLESLNAWIETLRFACEVQGVVAMRFMRLAQGGPQAAAEARLMVAEKIDAFTDAEVALARALTDGEGTRGRRRTRLRAGAPLRARQ